ncbi:hypothetical protein [Archangium sp.]|uniref:hypothetical protein n=1 Tax=Archangium sp. TaxID=1872627 RepID=UPI00389A84B1
MSLIHRRRQVVVPLLLGMLLLGACSRDAGPGLLAQAEDKQAELVTRGVRPDDPAWDQVLQILYLIPPDSKARPEAERRISRIKELQSTRLPPRPLARPDEEDGGSPSLDEHGHPMAPHEHPK